jgi:hypothetical protein
MPEMKKKRKVGRPKLNRPPVPRRLISVLKKDADFIQKAAKSQRRSVTQVINYVVDGWRTDYAVLVTEDRSRSFPVRYQLSLDERTISPDTPETSAGQAEVNKAPASSSSDAGATLHADDWRVSPLNPANRAHSS